MEDARLHLLKEEKMQGQLLIKGSLRFTQFTISKKFVIYKKLTFHTFY